MNISANNNNMINQIIAWNSKCHQIWILNEIKTN
jgi:hypothetical protein